MYTYIIYLLYILYIINYVLSKYLQSRSGMTFDLLFLQDFYTAFNYEETGQNLYLGLIFT